jgi:hypothetical protein
MRSPKPLEQGQAALDPVATEDAVHVEDDCVDHRRFP